MIRNHTRRQLLRVVHDAIMQLGWLDRLADFRGETLESVLSLAESEPGVTVYWGSFTDNDLQQVV